MTEPKPFTKRWFQERGAEGGRAAARKMSKAERAERARKAGKAEKSRRKNGAD